MSTRWERFKLWVARRISKDGDLSSSAGSAVRQMDVLEGLQPSRARFPQYAVTLLST